MTINHQKIKKFFLALFLSGVSLVVLFIILLAIPAVDDWLCNKLESKLSASIGRNLSIESFQYYPLRTISLRGIQIQDHDSVTIASATRIKASVEITSIFSSTLRLTHLDVDSLRLYVSQLTEDPSTYNILQLGNSDVLSAKSDSLSSYDGFGIVNLSLREAEIFYRPINGECHSIRQLNARINDVVLSPKESKASVSRIDMLVDDNQTFLSGNIAMRSDTLFVAGIKSYCGNSVANINYLQLAGISMLDSLSVQSPIYPSLQADVDLLVLSDFQDFPKTTLSGKVSANNDLLKVDNFIIDLFDKTHVNLDGSVFRWRTPEYSSVDLKLSNITLDPREVLSYLNVKPSSAVDSTLSILSGLVSLKGPADRVSVSSQLYGMTASVFLDSYASYHADNTVGIEGTIGASYNPKPSSQLLIGGTTAVVDFNGAMSLDDFSLYFNTKGNAPLLTVLNYPYHDVQFECHTHKYENFAKVDFADQNGGLHAVIKSEHSGVYPKYDLLFNADSLRLGMLGFIPNRPNSVLDCSISMVFDGTNLDNIDGELSIDNLSFRTLEDAISFKHIDMQMIRQQKDQNRVISFNSEKLKARMEGSFVMRSLLSELQTQFHRISPSLVQKPNSVATPDTWMNFELSYKDISPFVQLVDTNIVLTGKGSVSASLDASSHVSDMSVRMDQFSYADRGCKGFVLDYSSFKGDSSVVKWSTESTNISSIDNVGSFSNVNVLHDDILHSDFKWTKTNGAPGCNVSLSSAFSRDKYNELTSHLSIDTSFVVLGKRKWNIDPSSAVVSQYSLLVNNFSMTHDDRYLKINGKSSKFNPSDTLSVSLNRFSISDVLTSSPEDKFSLDGDVSALAYLNDIYGNIIVNCKSSIDNLYVDGDNLEHMDIETAWQPKNKNLDLHLGIVTGGRQCVDANGQLDIAQGNMFLNFDIDSLSIGFLNFYLDAAIDNMRGTTSGNLQLHGPLDDIKLDARLCVHHSTFSVKQTYVDYIIDQNDSIILSPSRMEFKRMRFRDRYGKQGVFRGGIDHDMFSNLRLFIDFDVYDMLVLDTQEKNNPSYYGTVFGNGYFGIRGSTSLCRLIVKAHTSPNSVFYILPLSKSEIGHTNYIRFSNSKKNDNDKAADTQTSDVSDDFNLEKQQEGVEAQLEVDIRPDAKIYAIVDPRSDNMLEGRGQGKINVELTREGALLMEGTYTMEQGTYNFNLQNIVNKKFDIRKGSTVMWNGDPYDAIVDLVATYKTRASLYDLVKGVADDYGADLKKRVPINCNLFLTEHLLNPNIRFEIEIPSSQNFSQYTFDQFVNTDEEMNRQVFSLLLAGRFYASQEAQSNATNATGGASTSNYLGTTLSELMSNQFSNWISQNKYNVGMGVNYRPGDEVTNEEYEVAVQTGVLDNKIVLSGNIGYGRDVSSESGNEGSFIGDFDVEVKLNKKETLRAKAYTHSNNDVIYETSPTTQGIGISYQESFDTFRELLHKYFGWIRRKKNSTTENEPE